MKKFLASLFVLIGIVPVMAADLPAKAIPAVPAPVVTYNPFYIGIEGGIGFTATENVIAQPGLALGTPKQYPTAPAAGIVLGYINNTGPFAWGGELFGDFNFSQQDLNCSAATGGLCLARSRNSWGFGEDFLIGFTVGQAIAVTPSNAQPQNWKLPITVPTSIMNNLMILASVGGAQRTVGLCALDAGTLQQLCGSEWMGGLAVGGQIRFMAATQWDVAAKYHHNLYNHSFTPLQSIPLFTNTINAKGDDVFKLGFNYHL